MEQLGIFYSLKLPVEIRSTRIGVRVGVGGVAGVDQPRVIVGQRRGVVEPVPGGLPGRHLGRTDHWGSTVGSESGSAGNQEKFVVEVREY